MEKGRRLRMECSSCGHANLVPVTEVFHVYENVHVRNAGMHAVRKIRVSGILVLWIQGKRRFWAEYCRKKLKRNVTP